VYLLRVDDLEPAAQPIAKIPRVLFPAADPFPELTHAAATMAFASQAKVYLLRVVVLLPIANIPLVLFPAADPEQEEALEAVAVPLISLAYVYLFLVVETVQFTLPSAKIPTVPSAPPDVPNPKPWAENAPLVEIIGILFKLRYGGNNRVGRICRFGDCVSINI
jgi:hypothetical protein